MAGGLLPMFRLQALDNGVPVPGAKLYTYASGTTTPLPTYTTAALTIQHANPVVADSTGLFPPIYLPATAYRVKLTTASGVTILPEQDNVTSLDAWLNQALLTTSTPTFNGVSSTGGIQINRSAVAGSGQGFRIRATNASYEVVNSAFTVNYYFGVQDSDNNRLKIGGGYGAGQGLTPYITCDPTTRCTILGDPSFSQQANLTVVATDNSANSDWVLWTIRAGPTGTNVSNHSRFQHYSGANNPEVVLSGLVARGTYAAPTGVTVGDNLFIMDGRGYDGTANDYGEYAPGWSDGQASIFLQAAETWSSGSHATRIRFYTTPTASTVGTNAGQVECLRLESTSVVNLVKGQLQFPATQNASTNENTLDDYEETLATPFTPTIVGTGGQTGQAYSVQVGGAVKVGRMVTAWVNVQLSTLGTITGGVEIAGLPYTSANISNLASVGHVEWSGLTSSFVSVSARVDPNTSRITLTGATAAATSNATALAQADLAATSRFRVCVTYPAAT